MDMNEADRVVVAKPVPSRPTTYSNFTTFSELLAGAINTSPSNPCSESTVSAIRPKTVRFKPTSTNTSQAETSGALVRDISDNVNKILNSEGKSTMIYRPLAKVVSRKTFSMLADLGNSDHSHQQAKAHGEAHVQLSNHYNYHFRTDLQQQISSSDQENTPEPPNKQLANTEVDQKYTPATGHSDRVSYDGYNWRKYGQKQVKGSEYPRSYYKCTHPGCPVKKKVERTLDGQIAEIVYKGEHNHAKPQPPKRNTSSSQGQMLILDGICQNGERNDVNLDGKIENQNEVGFLPQSSYSGMGVLIYDPLATAENSSGIRGDCEEAQYEPKTKKRKVETEAGICGEKVDEPQVMVPNPPTDSEIIGDGFRWRKYGQKVVKGNPYPRSYYRCTNLKCNMRKHVERSIDDPTSFVTTYEGRHNHEMPTKHPNATPSESDSHAVTSKDKP